eukprot:41672_1
MCRNQQEFYLGNMSYSNPTDDDIQIFIQTLNGETIALEVAMNSTIENIKSQITSKQNIWIEEQKLIFQGETLNDIQTLQDYNIQNKSIITLIIKTRHVDEKLVNILRTNNLYDDLYELLYKNNIDLDTIKNDIKKNELDEFCKTYNIQYKQKIKFRKLLRIINESKINIKNEGEEIKHTQLEDSKLNQFLKDHNLPSTLYNILLSENITFDTLQQISKTDIENICENHNIKIGTKICLQNVIAKTRHSSKYSYIKPKTDHKMTITLVGDSGVGKTSLMKQYVEHKFSDNLHSSFGGDFMKKVQILPDESTMEIKIWDTAGQERYNSICQTYYKKADVIILCYGVDSKLTLRNCEQWRTQIEENAKEDVIILLIGCKGDVKKRRELSEYEGKKIIRKREWKQFNPWWCECSAKTNDNIRNIFVTAATMVLEQRKAAQRGEKDYKTPSQFQQVNFRSTGAQHQQAHSGGCFC